MTSCDLLCMLDGALIMATVGCVPFVFLFLNYLKHVALWEKWPLGYPGDDSGGKVAHLLSISETRVGTSSICRTELFQFNRKKLLLLVFKPKKIKHSIKGSHR